MARTIEKKTIRIGSGTGFVIPSKVLYAENINRGDMVRVTIEKISPAENPAMPSSGLKRIMPLNLLSYHEDFAGWALNAEKAQI